MKRIFDVNKLDLAKIAKAFGFKVPPRVSLNVGVGVGGGAGAGAGKRKRRAEQSDEDGDMAGDGDSAHDEEENGKLGKKQRKEKSAQNGSGDGFVSGPMRGREGWSKNRREEMVGKKKLLKERYFRDKNTGRGKKGKNWSR